MIERRQCINKECRKTHRLLPDILISYKQYSLEVLEDAIDTTVENEESDVFD